LKDPLLGPLAAIASGILVARFVPFQQFELLAVIGAFLLLGVIAALRRSRILAAVCLCLGLFFTGALTSVAHQPGPAPELDAESREIVILGGCVVEPPAVSGERERFVIELEPHARAQVTLYTRNNESPPALRYGRTSSSMRACASPIITATRARSITLTTWPAAIFIGLSRARLIRCAFCPAIAVRLS
jgi:hypothetical protein